VIRGRNSCSYSRSRRRHLLRIGDKNHEALRAWFFASWLITEVLGGASVNGNVNVDGNANANAAKSAASVLDIAGGKGQLSIELSTQTAGIYCTVWFGNGV
jgi:2-polyprenyl-3-methyl-5-hydroxy-6-metoxy-1,4-benzoquinol methylase